MVFGGDVRHVESHNASVARSTPSVTQHGIVIHVRDGKLPISSIARHSYSQIYKHW